jgi:hypothetical protein
LKYESAKPFRHSRSQLYFAASDASVAPARAGAGLKHNDNNAPANATAEENAVRNIACSL